MNDEIKSDKFLDAVDKLLYDTEDDPGTLLWCSMLEDAANEIRRLRGLSIKETQYK